MNDIKRTVLADFNVSMSVYDIRKVLVSNKIDIRGHGGSGGLDRDEKIDVIKLYESGKSMLSISKLYGRAVNTIRKVLIDSGTDIKKMGDYTDPALKHDYFDNIDSETKAYFLGFLLTDGFIIDRKDSTSVTVGLDIYKKDSFLLDILKRELSSSVSIYGNKKRNTQSLRVSSTRIARALSEYGVVPNKTFVSYIPELENKNLVRHLLRGIFDGDGSISHNTPMGRYVSRKSVQIIGTERLVRQFVDILHREIGVKDNRLTKQGSMYISGWWSRTDIDLIYNYFYKNATIYLNRKKLVFEQEYRNSRKYREG